MSAMSRLSVPTVLRPVLCSTTCATQIKVRELIRKAVQVERQRRGMSYREVLEDHDPGPDHN